MTTEIKIGRVSLETKHREVIYGNDHEVKAINHHGDAMVVGTSSGALAGVAVFFDVDGYLDFVHADLGRQGDVETLDRAIATITQVRDELVALYGDRPRDMGTCYALGFGGQCRLPAGHIADDHDFPLSDESAAMVGPEKERRWRTTPSDGSWKR